MKRQESFTPDEAISPSLWRRVMRRALRSAMSVGIIVVITALLLGLVEGVLRATGYGESKRLFVPCTIDGTKYYRLNKAFYQQLLDYPIEWRTPEDELARSIPADKPDDVYRVFSFGGSAGWGDPDAAYSYARVLEVMLESRFPKRRFEVYSVAFPGINSTVMWAAAKECARLEPDMFLIYMGNNEFFGAYAAGAASFRPFANRLFFQRLALTLRDLRTMQLMNAMAAGRLFASTRPGATDTPFAKSPEELAAVYPKFWANLEEICRLGTDAGATAVLCTVGSNLRTHGPLAFSNAPTLSDEQRAAWQTAFEEGLATQATDSHAEALEAFRRAEAIDDSHSHLLFRIGQSLWATAQYAEAAQYFRRARALDAPYFVTEQINRTIAETAAAMRREGVILVDAARALEQDSPHGVSGPEFFQDRIHLAFAGNYHIAKAVFEGTINRVAAAPVTEKAVPSMAECQQRLGLLGPTLQLLLLRMWETVLVVLEVPGIEENCAHLWQGYHEAEHSNRNVDEVYAQALRKNPDDFLLRYRYLDYLVKGGDFVRAESQCREFLTRFPASPAGYRYLGDILAGQGKREQALRAYEEVVRRFPDDYRAWLRIARLHADEHAWDAALHAYDQALKGFRFCADAVIGKAEALARLDRVDQACAACRACILETPLLEAAYCIYSGVFRQFDMLLRERGPESARLAQWKQVAEARSELALSWGYVADAHDAVGQQAAAQEARARAEALMNEHGDVIAAKKTYADALARMARQLREDGDLAAAAWIYQEALVFFPIEREYLFALADVLEAQGRTNEAAQTRAIAGPPDAPVIPLLPAGNSETQQDSGIIESPAEVPTPST